MDEVGQQISTFNHLSGVYVLPWCAGDVICSHKPAYIIMGRAQLSIMLTTSIFYGIRLLIHIKLLRQVNI